MNPKINENQDEGKKDLVFDFSVEKSKNTILVTRQFNAGLSLVWDAFTKPEILDQWGAPSPWMAQTIKMDLKVGGRRFYKMVGPEGQEHFSVQDYTVISPKTNLNYISGFTDREENINPDFYGTENNLEFKESNGITTVNITIVYKSPDILQMMIEKGFREGFTMTLENLEKLLNSLSLQ